MLGCLFVAACDEEPQPRSIEEFVDDPLLLEAAVVRCSRNRNETRYDAECINAREAVKRISAAEEAERRARLERESERKRQALRRTQEAAAEARRRAEEARRRREEAEYLAQFGEVPPEKSDTEQGGAANLPGAIIPPAPDAASAEDRSGYSDAAAPAVDGGNAPAAGPASGTGTATEPVPETESETAVADGPADLGDIRDELRRRNQSDE